jgi:hypothetical protein
VRGRDLAGQGDHESPVIPDFPGSCLALQQRHRTAEMCEPVVPELFGGVISGAVYLRLRGHDFVEELAVAMLGTRFGVGLGHRDGLPERSPARGGDDDHPGSRRPFKDHLPFLG